MKITVVQKAAVCLLEAKLIQPFRITQGQHDILENILFSIQLSDGTAGYGEAAIASHITGETVGGTRHNLEEAAVELQGRDLSDYLKISAEYGEKLKDNPAALAAVEAAMMDALTRQWGVPFWKFFGTKPKLLKTDMTVVLGSPEESETSARDIVRKEIRTFKIKIGKNHDDDFERVLRVHRTAKRNAIYLDANQGFSASEMLRFLKRLAAKGVRPVLVEQPVPKGDWDGLQKVTRESKTVVVADESVSCLKDAVKIIREKRAGGINIKVVKFGIFLSREIATLACAAGLRLMIGSMMETELATGTSAHLAAGMGCFDYVDLDTPFFLKEKIMRQSFLRSNGTYDLRRVKAGIGVEPLKRG